MTREEWDAFSRGSAIRRAGYDGFRRNVAVAIGNWLASVDEPPAEAVAVLREALKDESELVREHAAWALKHAQAPQPVVLEPDLVAVVVTLDDRVRPHLGRLVSQEAPAGDRVEVAQPLDRCGELDRLKGLLWTRRSVCGGLNVAWV